MAIATSSDVLNGKTGYTAPGGTKITGSISATKGAQTYQRYYGQNQTISGGVYLTGNQTIYGIYTSGASPDNYKYGASMTISPNYMSTTGSYTGSGNATSSTIMSGYAGFVKGSQVDGSMGSSDLNPYPVYSGITISTSSTGSIATVSAHPSSGNGSSASFTAGIQWDGATLNYAGSAVPSKAYGIFQFVNNSYSNNNGLVNFSTKFSRDGTGAGPTISGQFEIV